MPDRITEEYSNEELLAWTAGYLAGWVQGDADGYARYNDQLVAAMASTLAGDPNVTDYATGVRAHERMSRARAAREEADAR